MNLSSVAANAAAFAVALAVVRAGREVVDNFFNLYTWDRAVAYGVCGGLGVWAVLAVYGVLL
jgi:hypothetical protein